MDPFRKIDRALGHQDDRPDLLPGRVATQLLDQLLPVRLAALDLDAHIAHKQVDAAARAEHHLMLIGDARLGQPLADQPMEIVLPLLQRDAQALQRLPYLLQRHRPAMASVSVVMASRIWLWVGLVCRTVSKLMIADCSAAYCSEVLSIVFSIDAA